jgi:hypothetical protein
MVEHIFRIIAEYDRSDVESSKETSASGFVKSDFYCVVLRVP